MSFIFNPLFLFVRSPFLPTQSCRHSIHNCFGAFSSDINWDTYKRGWRGSESVITLLASHHSSTIINHIHVHATVCRYVHNFLAILTLNMWHNNCTCNVSVQYIHISMQSLYFMYIYFLQSVFISIAYSPHSSLCPPPFFHMMCAQQLISEVCMSPDGRIEARAPPPHRLQVWLPWTSVVSAGLCFSSCQCRNWRVLQLWLLKCCKKSKEE